MGDGLVACMGNERNPQNFGEGNAKEKKPNGSPKPR